MDRPEPHDEFASLIARAVTPGRGAAPLGALVRGREDRYERSAADWLRRWTPRRMLVAPPQCSCAAGRCAVCG